MTTASRPMTEQQRFAFHAIGTTITGVEWLEKWGDGSEVGEDHPQLTELQLSNGDAITFDGAGEAYYQHRQPKTKWYDLRTSAQ